MADSEDMDAATDAAMFAAARAAGSTRRKASFAHGDILKYRKAFDSCDYTKSATIKASDLNKVISKLGYKISKAKIDVSTRLHFYSFRIRMFLKRIGKPKNCM